MAGELTIVGLGLIGASFALAARDAFSRVSAIEPDDGHAEHALAGGVIDARLESVPESAEAVLLACPVDVIPGWLVTLAEHPATVFDAGSVKGALLAAVRAELGRVPANYVPTHPIAGREQSGPQAASAGLFRGRRVILTAVAETDPGRADRVRGWWRSAGAEVTEMDPFEHDAVYARTSHLPHLLAFAYLLGVEVPDLDHTGGGFRDFSRIGASDPHMWTAIFQANRQALLDALDGFDAHLAEFRAALEAADWDRCRALIERARTRRRQAP